MTTENAQGQQPQTQSTPTTPSESTNTGTEQALAASQQPVQSQPAQATTPSTSGSTALGTEAPAEGTQTALGAEETSTEETKPPVPEFFGAPEGDATYEGFTLPEGSVADPELQTSFSALAKELGLNQKGAQRLVDYKTEIDKQAVKAWGDHITALKAASRADGEIGGAKYDAAVSASRAVIAKFGTPELRKMMNDYGVGDHPAMIRFMAKIAATTGETPTRGVREGSGTVADKPLHELFYGDSSRSNQGT